MPTFKVHVKWGKEKFTDIEANTDEQPMLFKAQLFALSGVQPERQKVMAKGVQLKDDDWGKMKLKDGVTLLMMGSADALPTAPKEKIAFVEDMTEAELATAMDLPAGLVNLGNTCYMNATLQCLRAIPELKEALKKYDGGMRGGATSNDLFISTAIRDLYTMMDNTSESFSPLRMLQVMHMSFPRFAEKSEHGGYEQQDANECWTELVRCVQKQVKALPSTEAPESAEPQASASASSSSGMFIDKYMGGEFEITMKCKEETEEEPTHSKEKFLQLSCFIEKEVKYLHTGLKNMLEETITKHSPTLDKDVPYLKTCKISRLPGYLAIQMVRFFYKEKGAVNAKILKDIKFPMRLDMYDLCTESLQQKCMPIRDRMKEEDDKALERAQKLKGKQPDKNTPVVKQEEKKDTTKFPYQFSDDEGSNNSGFYDLQAVLTHKGRSSSSGHYVAWVRRKGDEWLMFDDDNVTAITSEDILKLSGGGDWHCAYVLLYGPRILEVENEPKITSESGDKKSDTVEAMETEPST